MVRDNRDLKKEPARPQNARGAWAKMTPELATVMSEMLEALLDDTSLAELWAFRNFTTARLSSAEAEQFDALFARVTQAYDQRLNAEMSIARLNQLNESLSTLVAADEADGVYRALVEGVRRITGSDASFIALRDPEHQDVRMRLTHGTVTAGMWSLRLDLGVGIGGGVSATGEALTTENYLYDSRLEHDESVDAVVSQEGLQRLTGIPVTAGEKVLGVLFAANRSTRPIPKQAQDLISQLAAHAGNAVARTTEVRPADGIPPQVPAHLVPPQDATRRSPALDALLNKRFLHPEFSRYMSALASVLAEDHHLVAARSASEGPPSQALLNHVASYTRNWCTVDEAVIALISANHTRKVVATCPQEAPNHLVTASGLVPDVPSLPNLQAELTGQLAAGRAQGLSGPLPQARSLYSVLFGGKAELEDFVLSYLRELCSFDTERRGELGRTLVVYLGVGLQHRAAAERLHIHPNTLYRRFENLDRVLGPRWRSALDLVELQVALRLAHLVPETAAWARAWEAEQR